MQNSDDKLNPPKPYAALAVLAAAMIGFGLYIAVFVLSELIDVYEKWESNQFVKSLVSYFKGSQLIQIGEHPVVIADGGAAIVAYVFLLVLALVTVHVALALIAAGVKILSPTFEYQIAYLKEQIRLLKERKTGQ